jgi:hypothetical protein
MKAEQRDGIEYEFTTVLDLVHDGHSAIATKDRTGLFANSYGQLTPDVGKMLLAWLSEGKPLLQDTPPPRSEPMNPAQAKRSGEWERLVAILDECESHDELDVFISSEQNAINSLPEAYMDDWRGLCDAQTVYCDLLQGVAMQSTLDGLKAYWEAKKPEIKDLPSHLLEKVQAFKNERRDALVAT